jgi:hypothetical protein
MVSSATALGLPGRPPALHRRSIGIYADGDFRQRVVEEFVSRVHEREFWCTSAEGVGPSARVQRGLLLAIERFPEGRSLSRIAKLDLADDLAEIVHVVVTTSGRYGGSSQIVPGIGFRLFWEPRCDWLRGVDAGLVRAAYVCGEMHLTCPLWPRPIVGEECLYCGAKMLARLREAGAALEPEMTAEMLDLMLDAGVRDDTLKTRRLGIDGYQPALRKLEFHIAAGKAGTPR